MRIETKMKALATKRNLDEPWTLKYAKLDGKGLKAKIPMQTIPYIESLQLNHGNSGNGGNLSLIQKGSDYHIYRIKLS